MLTQKRSVAPCTLVNGHRLFGVSVRVPERFVSSSGAPLELAGGGLLAALGRGGEGEMDQDALLARVVPKRCVRPPPNKSGLEFRSVAKTQCGAEHLTRVRERHHNYSLVMRQLEETTEMALPTPAAPVLQRDERPTGTARSPAHAPAAVAASSRVDVPPRKASPRQVRRNLAACEARRANEFANPKYTSVTARSRVCVDVTTLRTVGSVPRPADRQTGGEEDLLTASLSRRSQSPVRAFEQASQAADKALYRVLG